MVVVPFHRFLAEADSLASFHVYVCASYLAYFAEALKKMDFQVVFVALFLSPAFSFEMFLGRQECVFFLQKPPTEAWTETEIGLILSQAYVLINLRSFLFDF